jgi:CDP-6-deoxy-D-xylo-4-hexulose-3-dehydrase
VQLNDQILSFIKSLSDYDSSLFPYIANKSNFDNKKDTVYYSGPFWDQNEIVEIFHSFLKGKWLASGEKVRLFEREFSNKFNFLKSVMVNSGSSANLVMIAALKKYFNWSDGNEVIVCACGFPTTIAPIIQNGLRPIFVDIGMSDLNWDIQQIECKITNKTVALFSSPVLGNPYDFDQINSLCHKYDIQLISDNCDSLGSKWDGKYLTDYSVASSCSFYPAHHITTIEGGMVSSNIPDIVDLARSFAWWGRDCTCVGAQNLLSCGSCNKRFDNWLDNYDGIVDHKYVFSNIGYNLKPADFQGAIGSVQLKKYDLIHSARRSNKSCIENIITKIDGIRVVGEHKKAETSWFGVPIVCESRSLKERLVAHLEKNRIQTRSYFSGNILAHPGYEHLDDFRKYPNSNSVLSSVFFLGCSPLINDQMIEYINDVVSTF